MDQEAADSQSATSATGEPARAAASGGRTARRLSAEQEHEVARLYAETRTPAADLAHRFGISQTSVMRIAQRRGGQQAGGRTRGVGGATRGAKGRASSTRAMAALQAERRFRVRFLAEQVVESADVRQAVARAEALGAIEISSIIAE
jgi:hypothetical protein